MAILKKRHYIAFILLMATSALANAEENDDLIQSNRLRERADSCINKFTGYKGSIKTCIFESIEDASRILKIVSKSKAEDEKKRQVKEFACQQNAQNNDYSGEIKIINDWVCQLDSYIAVIREIESRKYFSSIEGVYKKVNKVELMDKPNSYGNYEDILEIVPISEAAVYVKIRTYFTNAHKCSYEGVFEYKASGELIAITKNHQETDTCVMKLISSDDKLKFIELSPPSSLACQSYCGSRGSLAATEFDRKLKRRIRYLSRLKNSDEYADAIGQYNMQLKKD